MFRHHTFPCTPHHNLKHRYVHIAEYTKKVKADWKAIGSWPTDPYKLTSCGVAHIGAPSLGVQEPNMARVQTTWPHWKIDTAPMPHCSRAMWQEHPGTGHFTWYDNREVLWGPQSWVWEQSRAEQRRAEHILLYVASSRHIHWENES